MNIQQIDYILAINDLRSFGKAAEHCHVTQPTLSTMVGRLEEEFGVQIFDRRTKPLSVTKEGEQIIRQLRMISREIGSLHHLVSQLRGEESGVTLTIGVIPTVAPYLLPHFLVEFVRAHPQHHFVCSEMTTDAIIDGLESRELDVGILSLPIDNPELREVPLYNEPFLLLDKEVPRAQRREYIALSDIDLDRLWLLEEGHCMRNQVEKICGLRDKQGLDRNLDYQSGTIDTLLKFVDRYSGLTLLPLLATRSLSTKDRRYLRQFQPPIPVRTIGLLVHNHFSKHHLLARLKEAIAASVNQFFPANNAIDVVDPLG